MAFQTGNVSFRLFYLTREYDSSLVERFAKHIAPPIESLDKNPQSPIQGWVTGRHVFDYAVNDARCVIGPYLSVQQFKAEKKIPGPLLRAYLDRALDEERVARGVEVLPRKVKGELKARISAELLPKMPPAILAIPLVVDFRNQQAVAAAMSDAQVDAFSVAFREAAESMPILITAESAALKRKQINAQDMKPFNFTDDKSIEPPHEVTLGMDFLTWLWFHWEKAGAVHHLPDGREFGFMLEGPVTFFREGEGAHEVSLRKGLPLDSREAGTALACGKKLKRVKFTMAVDKAAYTATMDSDFAVRGLKLPKGEQDTADGKFEERMGFIETFWSAWMMLFDLFLDTRTDAAAWGKTLAAMRQWIDSKNA